MTPGVGLLWDGVFTGVSWQWWQTRPLTLVMLDNNCFFLVWDPDPKRPTVCVCACALLHAAIQGFSLLLSNGSLPLPHWIFLLYPAPRVGEGVGGPRVSRAPAHGRVLGARPESSVNSPPITFLAPVLSTWLPLTAKEPGKCSLRAPRGENVYVVNTK